MGCEAVMSGRADVGLGLKPALSGERLPERPLFAMRWTELRQPPLVRKAVMQGPWKYIHSAPKGSEELYHRQRDPREQHEVSARHPRVLSELRQALQQLEQVSPKLERAFYRDARQTAEEIEALRSLGYME